MRAGKSHYHGCSASLTAAIHNNIKLDMTIIVQQHERSSVDRLPLTPQSGKSAAQPDATGKPRKKKPNYAQLHKDSLPISVFPLPVFHPTQPISLLQLIWTWLRQLANSPTSHSQRYTGYLSIDSRSVHITDPAHVRGLWERGFFGKGTLSRSEPSWTEREKARLAARSHGGQTAEEATRARREERRLFKLERARLEREKIDRQKLVEQGKLSVAEMDEPEVQSLPEVTGKESQELLVPQTDPATDETDPQDSATIQLIEQSVPGEVVPDIEDQEHLQLTLEEAFFLSFALGVLDIQPLKSTFHLHDSRTIFDSFRSIARFDPKTTPGMDDQFILNYVVYHHFRSLGWVVRPGVKFSVDYLLYNRGPVFSHAEFAILIMPAYSDPYWSTPMGKSQKRLQEQRGWWWLHCINRVQSHVKKTLVLCYVDIPPPSEDSATCSVQDLLRKYKVREFMVRRWLMNRMRD